MSLSTRTARLLTRIAISVFVVFTLHVAANPRFEIINRIENYLYDARVRLTMPGTVDDRIVILDRDSLHTGEPEFTGALPEPSISGTDLSTILAEYASALAEPESGPEDIDEQDK